MWTPERLHDAVARRFGERRLLTVSNREPYVHVRGAAGVRCLEPASGVVSALDPVMRAAGGCWIAHGSGSADRETSDRRGRLSVPPGVERYTLRRIWLTDEEEDRYYHGFANEALWPLCHIAHQRPVFREQDWRAYRIVNEKFADAVVEEAAGDRPLVFIHDYHFALLPRLVKQRLPSAIVAHFWHIPWPNAEAFRICPWKDQILKGLLGSDLLAFHIQNHCNNFLDSVDREIESRIDRERFAVTHGGSLTMVRPHPISVDFDALTAQASAAGVGDRVAVLRRRHSLGDRRVILSVDRLDYTKGIPERLLAFDRLLERGAHTKRVVLLQIGVPSRGRIQAYREFQEGVAAQVERVNRKHGTPDWTPVVYVPEHQDRAALVDYYRLADVCLVSSLHDGMNLVAKEFVAARPDLRGVLVLSPFTGAARELTQALLVNPYDQEAMAAAMAAAVDMPRAEQEARMTRLRETVREHNVYRWIGRLLEQAAKLEAV